MTITAPPPTEAIITVPIARWAVAAAPVSLRTLLGSCVGVVLYDRTAKIGGLAHVLLPDSRGNSDQLGKYADTAVPALIAELERALRGKARSRLVAKIAGGAAMFQTSAATTIGEQNTRAVEQILTSLDIQIISRHLHGESGRRLTLDTTTGNVEIRIPGGSDYSI